MRIISSSAPALASGGSTGVLLAGVLLALALLAPGRAAAQGATDARPVVHRLLDNGPTEQLVDIVLVSEGYREEELPLFLEEARMVMDRIFAVSPFTEYRRYFNVLAVAVASNESGADNPYLGVVRDSYFDVTFNCGGIQRLPCVQWGTGADRLYALQEQLGFYNLAGGYYLLMVNDAEFGGSPLVVSRGWGGNFGPVVHEMGHGFANLIDEYEEPNRGGGYEGPNVTAETRREQVKWRHWFADDTPIPTPLRDEFRDRVGLFEGAIDEKGWFRPQASCLMRDGTGPFCAVCLEHMIHRLYLPYGGYAHALRRFSPADSMQTLYGGESLTMRVDTPVPEHGLTMEWSVNGVPVLSGEAALTLAADALGRGAHTVELKLVDENPAVRDPKLRPDLTTVRRWHLDAGRAVAVEDGPAPGRALELGPNFPNPVREATVFTFLLPEASQVRLTVLDLLGREVATAGEGFYPAGQHQVEWNPAGIASGVYVYRLQAGRQTATRRMVVSR